jgi:uncharacterized protein (TIGR03435 family)
MTNSIKLLLAIAAIASVGLAQPEPSKPLSFEAASVKPLKDPVGPKHFTVLPNRLDVKNMNLKFLIEDAYDIPDFQLSAQDIAISRHFDVLATTGTPVSRADMRVMLQNLLTERFHLATHWESRTEAIYRLVALPGRPKMKLAAEGYARPNSPTVDGGAVQLNGPMSMRQLAERLTSFAGKPVLDATGVEGYFIIKLTIASTDIIASDTPTNAPLLANALQEQLGLKLVSAKEAVKILVVDHADAVPTEN